MKGQLAVSALILAGGTGGAFSPMSAFMPKSLAFLGTKPIIHHIIDSISEVKIDKFYITLGEFGDMIERYINDTKSISCLLEFLRPQPGSHTAGSLLRVLDSSSAESFLVHYGDVLTERFDFSEFIRFHTMMRDEHSTIGTLAYSRNYPIGVGVLVIDKARNMLVEAKEKPSEDLFNINMAISLFSSNISNYISGPHEDLFGTVVPRALAQGASFAVFEHQGPWWHIHTVADLYKQHVEGYDRWKGK